MGTERPEMKSAHASGIIHDTAKPAVSSSKRQLVEFLSDNTSTLLGALHVYVQRMGLSRGEVVHATALEVLQEVAVEALAHADRFDPARQPMAWLLGIAANVIKRKKSERAKLQVRELSIARLARSSGEPQSESDLFEQIMPFSLSGPEQEVEANDEAISLLSLVSVDDREVLQLAFLNDFDREALAQKLGTSPVAARVRLHRALNRLRLAWHKQQSHLSNEGESHE